MEINEKNTVISSAFLDYRTRASTQKISFYCARIFVCLAIVCLPYSHFLVNQLSAAAAVFAILAGEWKEKWNFVKRLPFVWLGLALVGLFAIGLTYSVAPLNKAIQGLTNVTKILYIPFLLPLFACRRWREYAIHCFIFTVLLAVLISLLAYANIYHINPIIQAHPLLFPQAFISLDSNIIINAINFSVLACYSLFLLLNKIVDEKRYRVFYGCCFLVIFYHLFFINGERTGCYGFFILLCLFIIQRRGSLQGLFISLLLIPLMLISSYTLIPPFQQRLNSALVDFNLYKSGDYHTSLGYRLIFAKRSFELIKAHFIRGQGSGGFKTALKASGVVANDDKLLGFNDPHNEYILITVEVGILGLILFLLWLASLWWASLKLPQTQQRLVAGLILSFTFNAVTNIALTPTSTGFLFVLFIAVLFGGTQKHDGTPYSFNELTR